MSSFKAPRSVIWSAFRSGGLWSAVLTTSPRSPSGWVLRLTFRTPAAAATFARSAARAAGVPVSVRHGGLVSVPVVVSSSRPVGVGRPVSAVGGLRPFSRSVKAAGWLSC